jgi:ketosteroid isomerase-like protein
LGYGFPALGYRQRYGHSGRLRSQWLGPEPRRRAGEKEEAVAEALIRRRVEDYAKAISAKDIECVMSFFAPNLVSFDIAIKTLRYVGADGKRREWQKAFAAYSSIAYEVRDLNVATHGERAFVHAVNQVKGTQQTSSMARLF